MVIVGEALINKVSSAIGKLYEPTHIRRIAKAEVDANIIKAKGAEEEALIKRALDRFAAEETRKQLNIENITESAIPNLSENAKPENIDNDWITNFFDKCKNISDLEMQGIWSSILSEEANTPSKFSRKTINLLADLDKKDAMLFRAFCSYVWKIGILTPVIFDVDHPIYKDNGITFDSLSHLASLGLIHFDHLAGFSRTNINIDVFNIYYYGQCLTLKKKDSSSTTIPFGHVNFTVFGAQLAEICGSEPVHGFYEYAASKFTEQYFENVTIS